jgi:3-oxoacyl-[acyl-carrier-protein] synthase II
MRRIAITGLGAITAIGNSPAATFANALAARSGVRKAPEWSVGTVVPLAASAVFDADGVKSRQRTAPMDRATAMALAAARQAVEDSAGALSAAPERVAIYWGSGMGAPGTLEDAYQGVFDGGSWRIKPTMVVTAMNNAPAAQISLEFGITGPTLTYSVACASSAIAVGEALRAIRHGIVDCAIVGGSEAPLTRGILCAWSALRALAPADRADATRSCKPFAADRSGFVLGEGAGALVLEAADRAYARGARIYGELAGYGIASDAAHIAEPSVDGQVRAITAALTDADVDPADVGYINAHGTATIVGDRVEASSIRRSFGANAGGIAVSSTKALHGHVMGATGAIELIIATLALHHRCVPPTAHLDHPDPDLGLDFVRDGSRQAVALRAVVSNSFAFGGTNAVLVALDPAARLRRATA